MRALRVTGAVFGAALMLAAAPNPPLYGFTTLSAGPERALEARFLDLPSAQSALDLATTIGARPHYDATAREHELALWARDRFAAFGFDARIEPLTGRVDRPLHLALELEPASTPPPHATSVLGPKERRELPAGLDLREVHVADDPQSGDPAAGLPFNSGSGDGDVSAPIVYAARGQAADYATLREAGISVRGSIVLIRYGAEFRGTLAKRAQDNGAAGVVFYDDPSDGYGPFAVQRGSVGAGITIPVLPISPENARLVLERIRGGDGPPGWRGGLEAPYALGRTPANAHLIVKLERKVRTLENVVATLRGTGEEMVLLGAHRDAWVYGVGDNGAGAVTMLEVARGLGFLNASGWRPRRTITIALWDGEEIGLYGSAAFANAHARALRRSLVAYLNADENVTGPRIAAAASGALAPLVVAATHDIPDPARDRSTLEVRWRAQPRGITVGEPGGGSDHATFMERFGTPVLEFGFHGERGIPFRPYHSSFDTVAYAQRYSDPGFTLHRTAAQVYGVLALRLAGADVPPYAFAAYVPAMRSALTRLRARAERDDRAIDLAPLDAAVTRFAQAAQSRDDRIARGVLPEGDGSSAIEAAQTLGALLYGTAGYEAVGFPELQAGYERGGAALGAAIERARSAVERATARL